MICSQAARIHVQTDDREGLHSDLRWMIDSADDLYGSVEVVPFKVDSGDGDDRHSIQNLRIDR